MNRKTLRYLAMVLSFVFLISVFPVNVFAAPETLTIFHTNDVHGQAIGDPAVDEDGKTNENGIIGYARYQTLLTEAKSNGDVLVFDSGDNLHGSNFASLSEGYNMVTMMNEIGVEAFVPGNHDFNYGYQRLLELTEELKAKILAANVVYENTGKPVFGENLMINKGAYQIGVFGLATPETKTKSNPLNTQGIKFLDAVEVAKAQISELKSQGADLIILLSHLGLDAESEVTTYSVLDEVNGIDLVLDGHSHTSLDQGEKYKNTWIASTNGYFDTIGKVVVTMDGEKVQSIVPSHLTFAEVRDVEPDATLSALINERVGENDKVLKEVIGTTNNDLEGEREQVRSGETNLGNLITDAMLAESKADIVLTNGGGIRASIAKGDITVGDVQTVLPFGNALTVIKVTGQDVLDALKYGVDAWPAAAGKMPHVAGMKVVITATGTGNEVTATIDGEPIDPKATYQLATNDFMAVGGDGYKSFEGKEQVSLHGLLVDIVIDYIKDNTGDDGLTVTKDGRMTVAPFLSQRVSGENRFDTAVAISKANFTTSDVVVLASGLDAALPDALTAAPLAAKYEAPILLVNKTTAPKVVLDEIARLKASEVYVVGGVNSVGEEVITALGKDVKVARLAGDNRYETANAIANKMFSDGTAKANLYLASGQNLVDALSISNLAVRDQAPILLTAKEGVSAETKAIADQASTLTAAGGPAWIPDTVLDSISAKTTRLSGSDRYATAVTIAKEVDDASHVAVASGTVAVDALAAAPILEKTDSVLVLSEATSLPKVVATYLNDLKPETITVYGGLSTIGFRVEAALSGLVVPAAE